MTGRRHAQEAPLAPPDAGELRCANVACPRGRPVLNRRTAVSLTWRDPDAHGPRSSKGNALDFCSHSCVLAWEQRRLGASGLGTLPGPASRGGPGGAP